ncbi:DUF58 domain-containing protein [Sedimentitalea nanhaiensis]|uniref:DUF58 domain-containing protein n=1 Tax=Sedimentitalea nanhaiensis TaxID=999627 RepID=A0A1I7E5H6_9RHOB|nr:DUF58 domain-containing protein [Sedimentitalea nanhaiensis]SFU19186.1 Protein of unknown function DUF58 [Sedimentitalea nanhaiensis]
MKRALSVAGVALSADALISLRRVALMADAAPVLSALPGGFTTRRKGHGLEVADIREYVPGDDIRHLDRGTTARTGRLHIRQFQQERDRITLLVADFRPAMFWGIRRAFRSVAAAEALAMIGWNVVETGGRVALLAITPTDPIVVPPRGRTRGMLDVIGGMVQAHHAGLAAVQTGMIRDHPLDGGLTRADRFAPAGSELVLASGFDVPGQDLADRLDALARRRTPRLVLITDADSRHLPRGRYPIRLPDGRRARIRLGAASEQSARPIVQIAGRPALVLDAGDPVTDTARRIAAAFPPDRAA